ncbi:DUF1566 domain-containing protein [bacterium]|nr:DUF1566 domain-containing protein [bacterium]
MKKLFLIALLFMFAVISCGADEDDETDYESIDDSTLSNDSDSDTDTGKNDPVVEEKEACDKDMTFKCKTDQTDGTEYSYICEGDTSLYLYKYETCKAGCNTSTGKCNPYKDPDTGLTWSSVGIDESSNSDEAFDWDEARKYCNSLEENGLTGWRLPNIDELRTLIQNCPNTEPGGACKVSEKNGCLSPSECDISVFRDCQCSEDHSGKYSKLGYSRYDNRIFSSSTFIGTGYDEGEKMVWYVRFALARINNDPARYPFSGYVRCVLK